MATSLYIYFSPHALARSNDKTRRPISNKRPRNHKPRPKSLELPSPLISTVSGGDATTYTRLPPKDDFLLSLFDSPYQSPTEVKLSESTVTKIPNHKPSNNKTNSESSELSSDDEAFDEKSGFDYGKFELFEVNSDSDYENDDHDDGCDDNNDEVVGVRIGEDDVFDGDEEEKEKEKDKGLPAIMRCFDRAKLFVKAGDGGNGVVAFRHEKFVPLGGPSGGDGGRGGNVYVEVDGAMNSLLPFRQCVHFRAGRGSHGQGRKQNGAKGEDVVVKVPQGTVIREAGEDGVQGKVLLELLHPGQRALLLPGGRGGRGNASFKSGMNKLPKIAENGEEGAEM